MDSGAGSIDLNAPAIRLLEELIQKLPAVGDFKVTLFGLAPIQIAIDSSLASADVDLFSDLENLGEIVRGAKLSQEDAEFYIQVCSELNFRTSPRWRSRTQSLQIGNCTIEIPHPIDILIAKLNRLEEKDLEAFRVVRRKTGHPTEEELIYELQLAVDLFRPDFDEEKGHDMAENCRQLWPIDYKQELREAVESYKTGN
jgi:hypothetical protein